ncbi:MAG: hypothetical protein ABMA13_06410 [Chthoniobacteraceae bacterium]
MPSDSQNEAEGNVSLDQQINNNLKIVFNPRLDAENPLMAANACGAFVNLAGIYVRDSCPALKGHLAFDHLALREVFRRFNRDAFGVNRFFASMEAMEGDCKLPHPTRVEIQRQVAQLGIRINTDSPRKTKIAAAFSFWVAVLRPVYVRQFVIPGIAIEELNTFSAGLNFWIGCSYLSMYGDVLLPSDADSSIRLARIRYDLTYRGINLSSLEMLYASVFKLHERHKPRAPELFEGR